MFEALNNFTILYVDDDADTVSNITDILRMNAKNVFTAHNCKDGLRIYKKYLPDIVLTDVNMPKMDGISMARQIKEINSKQAILILTAYDNNSLLHQSLEIGIDGCISKPITDIEMMLRSLEKSAQRLQRYIDEKKLKHILDVQSKSVAIGEMIKNIAHQWRQPLTVISTCSSGLKLEYEMNDKITKEKIEESTNEISKQVAFLSKTIDDFGDFIQADTNICDKINFKETIEKTFDLVKLVMKTYNIEYHKDLEDNVYIYGNSNLLIQALINICNNAKDALIQNRIDDRHFFVRLKVENNHAILYIKDSGNGIPESVIDRIFEPYFTTKHPSVGTGLGLYISMKTIVRNFDGSMNVKNLDYTYKGKKLKGAEFQIVIPLYED